MLSGVVYSPGLPARGNAAQAAQGDECDCLHAAVSAKAGEKVFRDVGHGQIGRHIAVNRLCGDKIVYAPRLEQGIGLPEDNFPGQSAQIRGENDVGRLLLRYKTRLLCTNALPGSGMQYGASIS